MLRGRKKGCKSSRKRESKKKSSGQSGNKDKPFVEYKSKEESSVQSDGINEKQLEDTNNHVKIKKPAPHKKPRNPGRKSLDSYYKEIYATEREQGQNVPDSKKFTHSFPVLDVTGEKNDKETFLNMEDNINRVAKNGVIAFNSGFLLSCLHSDGNLVCVGTKNSQKPLNIFEKKSGNSAVLIFDNSLNLIKNIKEKYGDVLDIKIEKDIYVLFCNGNLIKYKIDTLTKSKTYNKIEYNKKELETRRKVVAFDILGDILAYTDGRNITINGKTRGYDDVIIDIKIYGRKVITLDVNGRMYAMKTDMSQAEEIQAKYTISQMRVVGEALIAFEDDRHSIILDSGGKRLLGLFVATQKSLIYWKHYRKRRKMKEILSIYRQNGMICIRKGDYKIKCEEIVGVVDTEVTAAGGNVIFCTEMGLIVKMLYI